MEIDEKLRSVIEGFKELCKNIGGKIGEYTSKKNEYETQMIYACYLPRGKYLDDVEMARSFTNKEYKIEMTFKDKVLGESVEYIREIMKVPKGVAFAIEHLRSRPRYMYYAHDWYGETKAVRATDITGVSGKLDSIRLIVVPEEKRVKLEL